MSKIHERTGFRTTLCLRVEAKYTNSTLADTEVTCSVCREARKERIRKDAAEKRYYEFKAGNTTTF